MIRISPLDGSIAWDIETSDEPNAGVAEIAGPDLDGRMYVVLHYPDGHYELVALQTNALPPAGEFCGARYECNRHDNGSTLDYRAR